MKYGEERRACKCGCGERLPLHCGNRHYLLGHSTHGHHRGERLSRRERMPVTAQGMKPSACGHCGAGAIQTDQVWEDNAYPVTIWSCVLCGWRSY